MSEHRFLDSDFANEPGSQFTALGHAGSETYVGLELFDNPGCAAVEYTSDEVVAYCPVTGQPDFYTLKIMLLHCDKCVESKSLKLWLRQFNNPQNGIFCEALAVYVRNTFAELLEYDDEDVDKHIQITLVQKPRGGITIKAVA